MSEQRHLQPPQRPALLASGQPDLSGSGRVVVGTARTEAVLAGRYRLVARVGADASVGGEFWRARDTVLAREVGLTILRRPEGTREIARTAEVIITARSGGSFDHRGRARLLDLIQPGNGGVAPDAELPADVAAVAVTEWVPGQSLAQAVARGPLRTATVLAILDPLAQAASEAHRHGVVLGCANPQRIRVTPDGAARVAFALPHSNIGTADDVRGLGAILYALLTGYWPLSGTAAERAGMPPAPRDVYGQLVAARLLSPGAAVEVSALAMGALGEGTTHIRVHTAAAVHAVLNQLLAKEQTLAVLPVLGDGGRVTVDDVWQVHTPSGPDLRRRWKLRIGLGGLGSAVLVALTYLGVQAGALLGLTSPHTPQIVVSTPAAATAPIPPESAGSSPVVPGSARTAATDGAAAVAGASLPAAIAKVAVFDPTGDPDNAGQVAQVIATDTTPGWSTYTYRQPFPALKSGVGIMVSLAAPEQLTRLTITSPSAGSHLEIRSAPTPDSAFAQTIPIAAITLKAGDTTVSLTASQPVQHILIWITTLAGGGDHNATTISHLKFERAPSRY